MSRIKSLDLARGFTVMMIAPIHTVLLYSRLPVRDTLMGKLMAFIAEGPGAQLFMMLMGVNFAMSRYSANQKSFSAGIKQAGFLLVAGYLLNIAKFVVPHFFGWIPAGMLADLGIYSPQPTPDTCIHLALTGDILQFASIAFLVMYGLSCLPYAEIIASALATLICICSPFAWDLHGANPLSNYLLSLAGGQPPRVFFPLFPWLVYPLVGYAFGRHLAKLKQKAFAFFLVRDLGWILIMTGIFIRLVLRGTIPGSSFYRTYPDGTLWHLGIVLVWVAAWQWVHENVRINHFFNLLTFMSRNITSIYIIQWIVICWMLPVFGYQQSGIEATLCEICITSLMTITISFFFRRTNKTST